MKSTNTRTSKFDTKRSLGNTAAKGTKKWTLSAGGKKYSWASDIERIGIIRNGLPYDAIEEISKKIDRPVTAVLSTIDIPQTTYNNKKREQSLLERKDSELVLLINEVADYGLEVFNMEEEKFQRWLKKPNQSLGGNIPDSMLDTFSGITEIKYALNRIEFGNLA